MMKLFSAFALLALLLAGCAKEEQAATDSGATSTASTPGKTTPTSETKAEGESVAYRNANGDLLCPVMNAPVKSEEDAVGFQDYEGTRYYFCCGGCPDKFKADPAKYAKK